MAPMLYLTKLSFDVIKVDDLYHTRAIFNTQILDFWAFDGIFIDILVILSWQKFKKKVAGIL